MGYVNDIACCTLTAEAEKRLCQYPTDATAIVVKNSPQELFFEQSRIEVAANSTIISENKLSPRLIYIDDKTTIHEYIQVNFKLNYKNIKILFFKIVSQLQR